MTLRYVRICNKVRLFGAESGVSVESMVLRTGGAAPTFNCETWAWVWLAPVTLVLTWMHKIKHKLWKWFGWDNTSSHGPLKAWDMWGWTTHDSNWEIVTLDHCQCCIICQWGYIKTSYYADGDNTKKGRFILSYPKGHILYHIHTYHTQSRPRCTMYIASPSAACIVDSRVLYIYRTVLAKYLQEDKILNEVFGICTHACACANVYVLISNWTMTFPWFDYHGGLG